MLNVIVWSVIKRAKIPTHKEPTGIGLINSKRPDGATLTPWSRGQALAWDVTVRDTYIVFHLQSTALEAGSSTNHVAETKCTKHQELEETHICLFFPNAIETAGTG